MERDSFVFYRSFYEAVAELDDTTRLAYYEALMQYALNGIMPEDNVIVKSLLNLVKPQIEANNRKYENGKKGGRPRKKPLQEVENNEAPQAAGVSEQNEPEPEKNQNETKENQKKPNDNQTKTKKNQKKPNETTPKPNVNVNVNVNDNVNVKEKQTKEKSDDFSCVCKKTIEYLNTKCGTQYDPEDSKLYTQILRRLKEGHTLDEFKAVIDKKAETWIDSQRMKSFLNPFTLFKDVKFDVYLGELELKPSSVTAFPTKFHVGMVHGGADYSNIEQALIEN